MPVTTQMHTSLNSNQLTYHDGYDSDGEVGPFYDAVANELDSEDEMYDEEEHGEPAVEAIQEDEGAPDTPSLTEEDVNKMTVAQLKEELHKRKQSVNGKKEVLQGRLLGAIDAPVMTGDRNKELQEQVTGFAPEAKWQYLTCNNIPVWEPT